jgi:hypothetical protein
MSPENCEYTTATIFITKAGESSNLSETAQGLGGVR